MINNQRINRFVPSACCLIIVVVTTLLVTKHTLSASYGIIVALINCLLSHVFYYVQQKRVSAVAGHAIAFTINATITRFMVSALLLVIGFRYLSNWMDYSAVDMMVGFVLGQTFYLFNQLTRISGKYGK